MRLKVRSILVKSELDGQVVVHEKVHYARELAYKVDDGGLGAVLGLPGSSQLREDIEKIEKTEQTTKQLDASLKEDQVFCEMEIGRLSKVLGQEGARVLHQSQQVCVYFRIAEEN